MLIFSFLKKTLFYGWQDQKNQTTVNDRLTVTCQKLLHTVSPGDYVAVKEELTFAPCESLRCVNVRLTDDLVNEPDETFSISLSSSSPHIFLSSPFAEVLVIDDDGKNIFLKSVCSLQKRLLVL